MARRMLVAGNWKMHGWPQTADGSADGWSDADMTALNERARHAPVDVAICPPATLIHQWARAGQALTIGGQDCHAQPAGAFTGWLSAEMLRDAGASLVIVGHSERRAGACESDADVRAKAQAGLRAGLRVIVCVGESEAVREAGGHVAHVLAQVAGSLPATVTDSIAIAYEPIWAIGTGKTATPADVAEMHAAIRAKLRDLAPDAADAADAVNILYGGSVNAGNAAELFAIPDVDGALVGGASLKPATFLPIVEAAAMVGEARDGAAQAQRRGS
jgi:triosephosphate isomerase